MKSSTRGSILVLSLWILTLLSLLALALGGRLGAEARLTRYAWDNVRLSQAAKQAALLAGRTAMEELSDKNKAMALHQAWSHSPEDFQGRVVEGSSFTLRHLVEGDPEGAEPRWLYGLSDEQSRINVNEFATGNPADMKVLEQIFDTQGDVVAAAVADWIDDDDKERPSGAEESDYEGVPPRNGKMLSVEELLLVKGMTSQNYARVKDWVTVFGSKAVNVNTAPAPVLKALGIDPAVVEIIMYYRRGEDGLEGTEDDGVFMDGGQISMRLDQAAGLTQEEAASLNTALLKLAVRSDYLRLQLLTELEESGARRAFSLVISQKDKTGRILLWREAAP